MATTLIAKRFDAAKLYTQASKAFTEAGAYLAPKRTTWLTQLAQIAQISMATREYAIMTVEDIEPIWTKLRVIPQAVDVLNYAMADLTMVMETTWDEVADALSEATRAILADGKKDELKAIDVPFHESFADERQYAELLRANRWLIMMLLLRRAGVFNLINRHVAESPAESAPSGDTERGGHAGG